MKAGLRGWREAPAFAGMTGQAGPLSPARNKARHAPPGRRPTAPPGGRFFAVAHPNAVAGAAP